MTRSRTLASGATPAEIADKLKPSYQSVDQINREGRKPDGTLVTLPQQTELLTAVFATDAGVENDPIDAQDNGVVWYEVLGVEPEQLKPFDKVKDEAAKDWRSTSASQGGETCPRPGQQPERRQTLEDIAKDLNVEILTSDLLKRKSITVNVPLPLRWSRPSPCPRRATGRVRRPSKRAASSSKWTKSRRPRLLARKKSNASSSRSNCC